MQSQFLLDKQGFKECYDNQELFEEGYAVKLTEVQCKHWDLEKQLADATLNIAPEQPKNESTLQKIAPRIVTR